MPSPSLSWNNDIAEALAFAAAAHGLQRYGDLPYACHLAQVLSTATEFGIRDKELLQACLLHDVLEDTQTPPEAIAAAFGRRVLAIVQALSKPPKKKQEGQSGEGTPGAVEADKKAREEHYLSQIKEVNGAGLVKLCDRVANMRACVGNSAQQGAKYVAETPRMVAALEDKADMVNERLCNEVIRLCAVLGAPKLKA